MIKGVNRQIVEINNPQDSYFEKVILYVKPGSKAISEHDISNKAVDYLNTLQPLIYNRKKKIIKSIITKLSFIGIGALLSFILLSVL